jgi:sensor c-di-GMP phosphodiesterase-like protein
MDGRYYRRYLGVALIVLATLLALVVPPWLAYKESAHQAYAAETERALGYARDVLHRTDETTAQIARGIDRLRRSGYTPCSEASRALMRDIDLESSYVQAIGYARDGVIVCSSFGNVRIPLGEDAFVASNGVTIYPVVPLRSPEQSPLLAVVNYGYAALIHRDLPIGASTFASNVSLSVMHRDWRRPIIARGVVDPAWMDRLGQRAEVVFVDDTHVVAIAASRQTRVAAIAAIPLAYLDQRTADIAKRLVPAGILAGLALAAAFLTVVRRRTSIEAMLKNALKRDEFFLLYQPIVELESGAWVGVEALLRWRRDSGEITGPDLFIPIAEEAGLIGSFTEHVLNLVTKDVGNYLTAHPHFHVAINLSVNDLHSHDICGHLDTMLARSGALPSNLIVEITERGFMNIDSARDVLAELRARSIDVAIDDFGTGYSSLSYLENLDLDFLKIDRSFIQAIGTGAPTSEVVDHVISIAHAMKLQMIAEGIENEEQVAFLRERSVRFGQGWLFGRPMLFGEVVKRVEMRDEVVV